MDKYADLEIQVLIDQVERLETLFAAVPFVPLARYRMGEHRRLVHIDEDDTCLEQPCAAITDILGERAKARAALKPRKED